MRHPLILKNIIIDSEKEFKGMSVTFQESLCDSSIPVIS